MIEDREPLEGLFTRHGFSDFRWIDPKDIVVAQWVRMKCTFGCGSYGRNASCPPNTLPVAECRQFFAEYDTAAVFHFEKAVAEREERHKWSREVNLGLLALERDVFLTGYQKAFLLFMDSCHLCRECASARADCNELKSARPSPEGMAVDVYSTVRRVGYPIQVLTDYDQVMNRYAFLLIR
jgi:predicted metal-binding protein